jgi:hypothetical protein
MMAMAQRRISSSRPERSALSANPSQRTRSSSGMTRSLQTMVDKAMVSTMTMPVAAERPPMNTNRASVSCWWAIGRVSTKVSASTVPSRKVHQPGQRHRQHEQVDQEQVERKQPDRAVEVRGVDVFHHRDLELARQQQSGEQRKEDQRAPTAVGRRRIGAIQPGRHLGHRCGTGEDVAHALVHAPDDEGADGQEGHQLDHRFDGDRRHHAFVTLGGIEVAGAEQDGEGGQDHRHVKRAVLEQGHGATALAGITISG